MKMKIMMMMMRMMIVPHSHLFHASLPVKCLHAVCEVCCSLKPDCRQCVTFRWVVYCCLTVQCVMFSSLCCLRGELQLNYMPRVYNRKGVWIISVAEYHKQNPYYRWKNLYKLHLYTAWLTLLFNPVINSDIYKHFSFSHALIFNAHSDARLKVSLIC